MATSNSLPACVLNVSLTSVSSASACEVSNETSTPIGVGTAAAADPAGSRLVTTPVHNPTASSPARNPKRVLIAIPHDLDIPDGPRPPSTGHPTATVDYRPGPLPGQPRAPARCRATTATGADPIWWTRGQAAG